MEVVTGIFPKIIPKSSTQKIQVSKINYKRKLLLIVNNKYYSKNNMDISSKSSKSPSSEEDEEKIEQKPCSSTSPLPLGQSRRYENCTMQEIRYLQEQIDQFVIKLSDFCCKGKKAYIFTLSFIFSRKKAI